MTRFNLRRAPRPAPADALPLPFALAIGSSLVALAAIHGTEARAQEAPSNKLPPIVIKTPVPKAKSTSVKKSASKTQSTAPSNASTPQPQPRAEPASTPQDDAAPSVGPAGVEAIGVGTTGLAKPATTTTLDAQAIQIQSPASSNTAQVLTNAPGVSMYQAGGVAGLPAINGMASDRVKVLLNGMVVTSACANHMNPPLSYTDPAQIGSAEVLAGVTPVSKGGDSIGGTIVVESPHPHFADAGQGTHTAGSISGFYRSNGEGFGTSATAHAATENVSLNYAGAWTKAENYEDGNGGEVKSTEYEAQNHLVKLGIRNGGDLFIVEGGVQYIPYQGFVNQRMDMVENQSWFLNSRYVGRFGWGKLDARAFYNHVEHEMNFLDDKKYNKLPPYRDMPMLTDGDDIGYSIKAEIPVSDRDLIRVGNEFHHQSLDDWWPATMDMVSMMGPDTYITLNGATRDRVGTFVEWERRWERAWSTLLGVRNDTVWMDTGDVQGYNDAMPGMGGGMGGGMPMMGAVYAADAAAFNAREHERTDVNFDATALLRFEPSQMSLFELGYAMKTRSPNLYERYTWSKVDGPMDNAQMAMNMIGWFGDGNGYVGNLDLEPETAHTVSLTMGWHEPVNGEWSFKVTPYHTYVDDYIGVRLLGDAINHPGFVNLQFANHDAELYGVNFSGRMPLWNSSSFGRFALTGVGGYVHGENTETGVSLYHMMPLHGRFTLLHALGGWTNAVELDVAASKNDVDETRKELRSDGYALVNLRSSYDFGNVRFDIGVENVFDTYFEDPLGGIYIEPTMNGHIGGTEPKDNVPGVGRAFYAGLTVKF